MNHPLCRRYYKVERSQLIHHLECPAECNQRERGVLCCCHPRARSRRGELVIAIINPINLVVSYKQSSTRRGCFFSVSHPVHSIAYCFKVHMPGSMAGIIIILWLLLLQIDTFRPLIGWRGASYTRGTDRPAIVRAGLVVR